jgi:hypothetical protein
MIAQGFYFGKLTAWAVGATGDKETPCLQLTFLLEDGQSRDVYLYLSDAALPYTFDKLERLGFNGSFEKPDFSNPEAELQCKHEAWTDPKNQETKTREKWDIAPGKPVVAPMDGGKMRQLSAQYRAQKSAPPAAPAKRPASPPPASAPPPAAASSVATPPPAGTAATKDSAWAKWVQFAAGGQPDLQKWRAAIAAVGKPESQFGPGDWEQVALATDDEIPF